MFFIEGVRARLQGCAGDTLRLNVNSEQFVLFDASTGYISYSWRFSSGLVSVPGLLIYFYLSSGAWRRFLFMSSPADEQ